MSAVPMFHILCRASYSSISERYTGQPDTFVELKTSMNIRNKSDETKFEKYVTALWIAKLCNSSCCFIQETLEILLPILLTRRSRTLIMHASASSQLRWLVIGNRSRLPYALWSTYRSTDLQNHAYSASCAR